MCEASVSSADGQQIVMTVSAIVESKTSGPSSIDMVNALQVRAKTKWICKEKAYDLNVLIVRCAPLTTRSVITKVL